MMAVVILTVAAKIDGYIQSLSVQNAKQGMQNMVDNIELVQAPPRTWVVKGRGLSLRVK